MHACRYPVPHRHRGFYVGNIDDEHDCSLFIIVRLPLNPQITVTKVHRFLLAQALAGYICLIAWSSSTVSNPPEQRAVALALINTISQSGNIVGSFVWVKAWGPAYKQSFAICGIAGLISLVMCLWLRKALKRMNKEMDLRDKMGEEAVYSKKGWRYYT